MQGLDTKGAMITQVDLGTAPRSGFDGSFSNFLSGKIGTLIPTRIQEVMPGDRFAGKTQFTVNFEPLAQPTYGNMYLKHETFFVPFDQIFRHYDRFFSGKRGFNLPVPSISIQKIISNLIYLNVLPDFQTPGGSGNDIGNGNFAARCLGARTATLTLAQQYGVVDLVKDYTDMLQLIVDLASSGESATRQGKALWLSYFPDSQEIADKKMELKSTYKALWGYYRTHGYSNSRDAALLRQQGFDVKQGKDVYTIDLYVDELRPFSAYSVDGTELFDCFFPQMLDFFFGPSSLCDYSRFCGSFDSLGFAEYLKNDLPSSNFDWSNFASNITYSWLPIRAMYNIWYHNYRDQLLETAAPDPEDYQDDTVAVEECFFMLLLRYRCWSKDLFTTALTNTGDGNLLVPISDSSIFGDNSVSIEQGTVAGMSSGSSDAMDGVVTVEVDGTSYSLPSRYLSQSITDIGTDSGTFFSTSMLDRVKRLQKWISKRLVTGVEYSDVVYSSWHTKISNIRLHFPELLESYRTNVAQQTIVNNTNTAEMTAGDRSAIAYVSADGDSLNYFSEFHGYLISFATICVSPCYPNGFDRKFLHLNRFDFPWPEFATLGMSAVYNGELQAPSAAWQDANALSVFGYQGQYYDAKFNQDEVHGRFKTDLRYLTFSRDFSLDNPNSPDYPKLNYSFVHMHYPNTAFVMGDESADVWRAEFRHNYGMERMLPIASEML